MLNGRYNTIIGNVHSFQHHAEGYHMYCGGGGGSWGGIDQLATPWTTNVSSYSPQLKYSWSSEIIHVQILWDIHRNLKSKNNGNNRVEQCARSSKV